MKATVLPMIFLVFNSFLFIISFVKDFNTSNQPTPLTKPQPPFEWYQVYSVNAPADSLCTGSLGENIFTDGDFGSGSATNLIQNPGLAPGYAYQGNPPPNDGFYTLSNNTSNWGQFAGPNWIDITDNSQDADGYMMVVNASFEPGIFYENTIEDLCGNTLYEFSADVINMVEPGVPNHIRPNVEFLLDGVSQFNSGEIAQDATWRTYGFSFITAPSTTSLNLAIRNNAPGGIGNDLALDNITFRPCGPEVIVDATGVICEDEEVVITATIIGGVYTTPFYQWQFSQDNGLNWANVPNAGNGAKYTITDPRDRNLYRLLMANSADHIQNFKCRVVSTVERLRVVARFHEFDYIICQGTSVSVGNSIYNESGTYVDPLISPDGCDSIVTSHITVVEDTNVEADISAINPFCPGESSGSISVGNVWGGYSDDFSYSINGGPLQSSPSFLGLSVGSYDILVQDAIGCSYNETVQLNDPPELTVQLIDDTTIDLGDSIKLTAMVNRNVRTINWDPEASLSCTNCLDPFVKPLENSTYQITVYNSEDCTATDEVNIRVQKKHKIYIPNAFSPNDDGKNDFFTFFTGADVAEIRSFAVFDRWGAMVYDFIGAGVNGSGWDGYFKGELLPSGVYVYMAEVVFIDGEEAVFSGDVLLLR